MTELQLLIKLRTITIDFELAVSNIFTKYYLFVVVYSIMDKVYFESLLIMA